MEEENEICGARRGEETICDDVWRRLFTIQVKNKRSSPLLMFIRQRTWYLAFKESLIKVICSRWRKDIWWVMNRPEGWVWKAGASQNLQSINTIMPEIQFSVIFSSLFNWWVFFLWKWKGCFCRKPESSMGGRVKHQHKSAASCTLSSPHILDCCWLSGIHYRWNLSFII